MLKQPLDHLEVTCHPYLVTDWLQVNYGLVCVLPFISLLSEQVSLQLRDSDLVVQELHCDYCLNV